MITPEQLANRRNYIGASDVAAILGMSPWATAYDVWAEKTGRIMPVPPTKAQARGNRFERVILDIAEDQLGPLERDVEIACPTWDKLVVHLDARVVANGNPVEAKLAANTRNMWQEDGEFALPPSVAIQIQAQLLASEKQMAHAVVMFENFDDRVIDVPREDEACDLIMGACKQFWRFHVEANVPPAESEPSKEILRRMRRSPAKVVLLDAKLVAAWGAADAVAKNAMDASDDAKAAVLKAMGDAEAGDCELGRVTYLEQNVAPKVDRDLLKSKFPEAHAACVTAAKARVMRFKPLKGG